ncbi:Transmembrane protein 255B [Acipenser ruthenus]|uniref:Transmembrane protein 255B n=1 Tax=Acipenser ruthenus TaxID=7906 RepID=A0A662Z2K5_ACIRT|nr:Transmembrane protein 255B [Acipenser ruthenus]
MSPLISVIVTAQLWVFSGPRWDQSGGEQKTNGANAYRTSKEKKKQQSMQTQAAASSLVSLGLDRRPLSEGRCQFYSSGSGYAYDNYHTEVLCYTFSSKCKLRVKSNTCYCCDLYNCESPERYSKYYEYTGVSSCMDASHLYRLLWASVVLNVLGLFLGIVTAAILGAFKDIKPVSQINCSSAPPHILYNPAQQVLTYAGFCPSNQALPAYPNYPLPVQHHSGFQAPSSADTSLPDDSQASSSYVLSPNAPSLYTPPYNPGDKPPPYAS